MVGTGGCLLACAAAAGRRPGVVQARVLKRNGKLPYDGTGTDLGQSPERDGMAKKDTILLGPNSEVEAFVKFRDHTGPYVCHCHNLEHEDHALMARFDVI